MYVFVCDCKKLYTLSFIAMGHYIKKIFGDESNPLVPSKGFVRPDEKRQEVPKQRLDQSCKSQFGLTATDFYRLSKMPVFDPRLQLLRAQQRPPWERAVVRRTLLERLLDQLENRN